METFVLIPNFNTQKGISKKLQPLRKGPYQIIAKPTDVTYKIIDSNKKEIVQHRNNLLPYYPKEYARPRINPIIFFHRIKNYSKRTTSEKTQNKMITPPKIKTQNQSLPKTIHKTIKNLQNKEKIEKMTEQIIPQEEIDKSEHRKTTRLRNRTT